MSSDNTKKDKSFSGGENGNITDDLSTSRDSGKDKNISANFDDKKNTGKLSGEAVNDAAQNNTDGADNNGKIESRENVSGDEKFSDTGFIDENSSIFTAPTIKAQKKKRNSKKSRIIKLIIAIIVMLALVAAAIGIVLIFGESGGDDVSSSSSSDASISVKAVSASDISRVEVHNQYGSYVISAAGDSSSEDNSSDNSSGSGSSSSSSSDDLSWKLENVDERIPIDDEVIAGIPEAAAVVNAQRKLADSAESLANYGLDNPEITIKVTLKNGEEYTISIGNATSIDSGRYIQVSGDDAIYLSESGYEETFDTSTTYFAELVIVSALEESSTYSKYFSSGELIGYDSIKLSGSIYPQPVELAFTPDDALIAYQVTAPISDAANEVTAVDILSPLSGSLYASETYVLSPDAATLSEYGFDNPTSVVEYTIKDVYLKVTVGKADGDGYYAVMINDIPAIYKVSEANIDFAMYSTDDIYYTSILVESISDIQSITFKTPDNEYLFELEHTSTTTTDEDGNTDTKTDIIVRYNGAEISSVDFRTFYQHLLLMKSVEAVPSDVPDTEPEYVLTLTHVDSSVSDTVIKFTKYSSRRYIAEKQGGRQLCITSDTVNAYVTYIQNLINGEEVPEP